MHLTCSKASWKTSYLGPYVHCKYFCYYSAWANEPWVFKWVTAIGVNFYPLKDHLLVYNHLQKKKNNWQYMLRLIYIYIHILYVKAEAIDANAGLLRQHSGKESACNARDPGSIPGSGRSPGEGDGNPLQFSCLGNPMDRGAWWATVCGVVKSRTRLSTHVMRLVHIEPNISLLGIYPS